MSRIPVLVASLLLFSGMVKQAQRSSSEHAKPRTLMTLPQAIKFIQPSIVQITLNLDGLSSSDRARLALGERQSLAKALGTGFLVNEAGYVLTANHVIKAFEDTQVEGHKSLSAGLAVPNGEVPGLPKNIHIDMRAGFDGIKFDIVDRDVDHDLILLKLQQNPFKGESTGMIIKFGGKETNFISPRAATLSPARPQDGEAIAVSGYPLNSNVLVTTSGTLASSWPYTEGVQVPDTATQFRTPEIMDFYFADVRVNGGNSGGPVYSVQTGKVIGVCVSTALAPVIFGDGQKEAVFTTDHRPLDYNAGLTIMVPIRYALDLLKKHNLKWKE